MKYKNPLTLELLKEFRKFQKHAGKNMYAFRGNQEEEFNKNIKDIIRRHDILAEGDDNDYEV